MLASSSGMCSRSSSNPRMTSGLTCFARAVSTENLASAAWTICRPLRSPISTRSGFCNPRLEAMAAIRGVASRRSTRTIRESSRSSAWMRRSLPSQVAAWAAARSAQRSPTRLLAPPRSASPITSRSKRAATRSPPGRSGDSMRSRLIRWLVRTRYRRPRLVVRRGSAMRHHDSVVEHTSRNRRVLANPSA